MQIPNTPTVAYAAGYTDDHGADTACPELELWRAVLRQAVDDLSSSDEQIRAEAIAFFQGPELLDVMDMAGIARGWAPALRAKAKELDKVPPEQRQRHSRFITYQGQTRSLSGWAEATGLSVFTLCHRLRYGWSIEKALTLPSQKAGRRLS